MDIGKLNPSRACDVAQEFDLLDPVTNEPITDESGRALSYSVLGMMSQKARNLSAEIQRGKPEDEDKLQEHLTYSGAQMVAELVTKLSGNWEFRGKKLKAQNKASLRDMLISEEWIATQIATNASNVQAYRVKILSS